MDTPPASDLDRARLEFRAELLESGLLIDAGEPGLYGRSGQFDDLFEALDAAISATTPSLGAERMRFPPVFPRSEFERTDYIASFPQLTASINGFIGDDRDHAALLAARANGESWEGWLSPAETMLVPAVCHPLYARLTGVEIPANGRVFDLQGYSFRHEPSLDPMRLQAFRIHEFVFVGAPDDARERRDEWAQVQHSLLVDLGLAARIVGANDPFFGRAGRILVSNQLRENLKLELVVPIYGDLDTGTAVASANRHGDHFGASFDIRLEGGGAAHTACIGFGMERILLALLRTHGLSIGEWPSAVLARLGLPS
jgi:seryl-tRNA synthetase